MNFDSFPTTYTKIFIIIFPDLKKDDLVILVNDEQFVKSALISSNFLWDDKMRLMLGKTFSILETTDGRTVALPSPDGSQDGKWYFPKSVVTKIDACGIEEEGDNSNGNNLNLY